MHEEREEITGEQAIEEVKTLAAFASSNLPQGYIDAYDCDEDDPFFRIPMHSSFDITMYADGYALIDGGEVTAEELALDILSLLTVFRHYQATGVIK